MRAYDYGLFGNGKEEKELTEKVNTLICCIFEVLDAGTWTLGSTDTIVREAVCHQLAEGLLATSLLNYSKQLKNFKKVHHCSPSAKLKKIL